MGIRAKPKPSPPKKALRVESKPAKIRELELREEICEWVCGWEFELKARAEGSLRVAGVDEVGRGPLFGPVVAAAVILPPEADLEGLNDSKKLCEAEREKFDALVREIALAWAIAE